MATQLAYCSACDQEVRIVVTPAPVHGGQAVLPESEVVCLDFGARCTGSMCPMFGLPRIMMGVRLARSGMRPEVFRTVTAPCQQCGCTAELQIIDKETALCPACGGRNRWIRLNVDGDDYLALAGAGTGE
jgi:hypothetical protein